MKKSDLTARLVTLIVAATVTSGCQLARLLARGASIEGQCGVDAVRMAEREGHPELVPLLR